MNKISRSYNLNYFEFSVSMLSNLYPHLCIIVFISFFCAGVILEPKIISLTCTGSNGINTPLSLGKSFTVNKSGIIHRISSSKFHLFNFVVNHFIISYVLTFSSLSKILNPGNLSTYRTVLYGYSFTVLEEKQPL